MKPGNEPELVWQYFDCKKEGFFVDVGAGHPKNGSQTWFLESQGWRGILIEPQSSWSEVLRKERPKSEVLQIACGAPEHSEETPFYVAEAKAHSSLVKYLVDADTKYARTEMVKARTLDEVLAEAGNPVVDFISIDVEGTEFDVLRGLTLQHHEPALLLIEDHLYDLRAHRHLLGQGYRLAKRTGLNNWYVPKGKPFSFSTRMERLRLWKKIWLNTPIRKLRVWLEHRRAGRQQKVPSPSTER